jgi:Gnt-I system high-affinity gluconate transporter
MTYVILLVSLIGLIVMTTRFKINPFLAFIIVTISAGLLLGLNPGIIINSLQKGLDDTLGSLAIIVCIGAMLGNLIAKTGAAQQIAETLVRLFGVKYIQFALVCTGFVVGTTMFYGIGFFLLVPLIFSVVFRYKLPAVYIGLPTLAALSVMHGYLPPHPAPTALATQLGASIGTTLFYGIIIAIPAILVAGPLFAITTKNIKAVPRSVFQPSEFKSNELPGAFLSFTIALLPVILLLLTTPLSTLRISSEGLQNFIALISHPTITLLIGLFAGTYFLGLRQKYDMVTIMKWYEAGLKDVSPILFIIGGAGALKQVFMEAGVDKLIAEHLKLLHIQPLVMGWMIAAILRIAIGSSTIAGLMTAGIMYPILVQSHVNPNLMVLSIGAGSMICAHVNDSGFWLFKEYFNLTIKQTFLTFTLMESLVAIMGLIGVLLLNAFIR